MPQAIPAAIAAFTAVTTAAATVLTTIGIPSAIATGIVNVGVQLALSAGINALTTPDVKSAPAQLSVKTGAILPRTLIMGRTAVAGMAVTPSMFSGRNNGIGSFVRVLSGAGESGVIEKVLWDDEEISVSSTASYLGGSRWLKYTNGSWTQSAIDISAGYAGLEAGAQPTEWTSNHKCLGCMTAMFSVGLYNEPIKSKGIASKIGLVVYNNEAELIDPRTGTAATGSALLNPFVWAYSYALGKLAPTGKKLYGGNLTTSEVHTASFAYAANIADANGFTIGGEALLQDDEFWNNIRGMAQAGGGDITTRSGKLYATVAAARSVVYYVKEDDFRSPPSYQNALEYSQVPNSIIPRFRSPDNGYELIDGSEVTDVSFLADDDDNPKVVTTLFPFCGGGATQSGKLAGLALVNAREDMAHSLQLKAQARYKALVGDCVEYDTPNYTLDGVKISIENVTIHPDLCVDWECITETDSKYAWALGQTTTAPSFDTVAAFDPTTPVVPDVTDWTPTAVTISGGGADLPIIQLDGAVVYPDNIGSVVPYLSVDSGVTWLPQQAFAPTETTLQLGNVTPDTAYDVGVAYINNYGVISSVVNIGSITTDAVSVGFAPNTVGDYTAGTTGQTAVGDGWVYEAAKTIITNGGKVLISASCQSTLADDPGGSMQSSHSIRIRRGTTEIYKKDDFAIGAETSIGGTIATPWSATIIDEPAAGTYTYYLQSTVSFDGSVSNVKTIGARSIVATEL